MKKFLNLLLCVTFLSFVACDDDNDGNTYSEESKQNGILLAITADTSVYSQDSEVDFAFGENNLVSIKLVGVKFSERMPMTVDLQLDSIAYTRDENSSTNTFSADVIVPKYNGAPFPRYTFTNLQGEFAGQGLFTLSFTTSNTTVKISNNYYWENDNDTITSNGNMVTILGPDSTFTQENVKVKFAQGNGKANIEMLGAKFAEKMPLTLDMTIGNVTFTKNEEGITFSGDSIVPQAMGSDFPRYTITQLEGKITDGYLKMSMICGSSPVKYTGMLIQ